MLIYSVWYVGAAMIQQPRLPSTGQMSAIDVHIRAKEVHNLFRLGDCIMYGLFYLVKSESWR